MKEFSVPLLNKYERPIIELYNLPTLIDTGAVIPVASVYPSIFEKYFETTLIVENQFIGGIGGLERGAVYSIAEFKIGAGGKRKLICSYPYSCFLICHIHSFLFLITAFLCRFKEFEGRAAVETRLQD